jgi:1-aminocyclopropane-1-carboxylate deaminase/D-cysteine desulfhydrase-like pyridoxal-dependent ACC family enzyme
MSAAAFRQWAAALPREPLGSFPTPLEEAPRLSADLGIRLLVKREDLAGLAFGGNKVRKLELLVADPAAAAASVWMSMGGAQSNYSRETAAAAARLGKRAVVFLRGDPPAAPAGGNVLVDELLGAEVVYVPADDYGPVIAAMTAMRERLARAGETAHAFPLGGADARGVAAWALGAGELLEQADRCDATLDAVVVGAGTGSTALGLALGIAAAGADVPVSGVSASWPQERLRQEAARLADEAAEASRAHGLQDAAEALLRWDDREIGPAYTQATEAGTRAVAAMARHHGLIGDLTYSGKAFAGLRRLVDEGRIAAGSTVAFVHTGGAPELFARPGSTLAAFRRHEEGEG